MLEGKSFIPLECKLFGNHLRHYFFLSSVTVIFEDGDIVIFDKSFEGVLSPSSTRLSIDEFKCLLEVHNLVED